MKIKFLMIFALAAVAVFGACKGSTNANMANTNTAAVMTPTPVMKTDETAMTDPNMKGTIESALKAKGFNEVTVDTSTTPATLNGMVAKGKMDEMMAAAMASNGGKPLKNNVKEK